MNCDWRAQAKCRGMDPAVFHPHPETEAKIAAAKAICAQCPVIDACRSHAITARENHGIWGGTTHGEREARRRAGRRHAVRHALPDPYPRTTRSPDEIAIDLTEKHLRFRERSA